MKICGDKPIACVKIWNQNVNCLIDIGSQVSTKSYNIFFFLENFRSLTLQNDSFVWLTVANGLTILYYGYFVLDVYFQNKCVKNVAIFLLKHPTSDRYYRYKHTSQNTMFSAQFKIESSC